MDRKQVASRILDEYFSKKSEDKTLGCHVVAASSLGENSVKLVISSASPIDLVTIREFVFSATDRRLIPYNNTFMQSKSKDGMYYASIIAYRSPVEQKAVEENPGMVQVAANSYLDQELGEVWEKSEIEGKKYFIKKNNEDIEEILKAVAHMTASSKVYSNDAMEDFTPVVLVGNYIEFFTFDTDGKAGKALGKVEGIEGEALKVKVGETLTNIPIPIHAVTRVIADIGGGDGRLTTMEDVIAYLKKAYPKEYADKVQKMK